jgi:predicted dehydrogenase
MNSTSRKLGMGLVGPGFVAAHHIDAVRRLGNVEVIAIAGSSQASAERKARELNVPKAYGSYEELLADPAIDVIHNTTPNHLHFPVSMAALNAGKHVISDKPLAFNREECTQLAAAAKSTGLGNVVTFNYRGNPLVEQARLMIANGAIGRTSFIHGCYLQDWMADPNVYSWRSDPAKGGVSSALADIGSHWCDLAMHLAGLKITAVLGDLATLIETRYAPEASDGAVSVEAFKQSAAAERRPVRVTGEDLATVLLRFENGVKGSLIAGQVLPGHKNDLRIEINGSDASLRWLQEHQNELWIGHHREPNQVLVKDPSLMLPGAASYAHLPGGHQEGWPDAFRNVIADAYKWIAAGADPASKPPTICTFADARRVFITIEAMLQSHAKGGVWTEVAD